MSEWEPSVKAQKTFEIRKVPKDLVDLQNGFHRLAETFWESLDAITIPPGSQQNLSEAARLISLAKTSLEETVMFADKALSRFSESSFK